MQKKKAQCAGASEAKITNIWQHVHCSQNNMTKSLKSSFQKTTASKVRSKVKGLTKRKEMHFCEMSLFYAFFMKKTHTKFIKEMYNINY